MNRSAEEKLIASIVAELQRQAENSKGALSVKPEASEDRVVLHGAVDVAALAMVAAGSLAGGP
jgi:hypothetical protein